jgi:hypothetical protein
MRAQVWLGQPVASEQAVAHCVPAQTMPVPHPGASMKQRGAPWHTLPSSTAPLQSSSRPLHTSALGLVQRPHVAGDGRQ